MSSILSTRRLALGTAQFGLDYGIANHAGQVRADEVAAILRSSTDAGLEMLDTAIAYGDSEARLGQMGVHDWQVVSKLAPLPDGTVDVRAWVNSAVMGSLARLKVATLSGLLFHQTSDLLGQQGDSLYAAVSALKSHGLVKKIGISIYQPDELTPICERMSFDIVQAPFNIFDRRLIDSGWMNRLHAMGVELHVRSVFMQGLLLIPAAQRPAKFQRWQPLWDEWARWLHLHQLTPLEACLRFVLAFSEPRRVIVGVDTSAQLAEILQAAQGALPLLSPALQSNDVDLLNPSNWHHL